MLGGDRDAVPLKGFFVAPQVASGRREQGDVARPADPAGAGATIEDHFAADQAGAQLGDGFGFGVALLLGGGPMVASWAAVLPYPFVLAFLVLASRRRVFAIDAHGRRLAAHPGQQALAQRYGVALTTGRW